MLNLINRALMTSAIVSMLALGASIVWLYVSMITA